VLDKVGHAKTGWVHLSPRIRSLKEMVRYPVRFLSCGTTVPFAVVEKAYAKVPMSQFAVGNSVFKNVLPYLFAPNRALRHHVRFRDYAYAA